MVNKRQKLARKRFKEANPELFPKPEPTPPKDPNKKKKKKRGTFKRIRKESIGPEKSKKSAFRKHPLRVPGMRPGESCYICKAKDHIAKHCPEKAQWEKNKICLLCRHRGHTLKNCPNKGDEAADKKLCFNCGQTGHSLSACPQPLEDGGSKFATCFICSEKGHLSKNCPKNSHGVYPKGGCCKTCGEVTHLAKDCPNKGSKNFAAAANGVGNASVNWEERPRGQVTKFVSGDDLDDDFITDDTYKSKNETYNNNNDESSESKPNLLSDSKSTLTKPKKKKGPTVVKFVG